MERDIERLQRKLKKFEEKKVSLELRGVEEAERKLAAFTEKVEAAAKNRRAKISVAYDTRTFTRFKKLMDDATKDRQARITADTDDASKKLASVRKRLQELSSRTYDPTLGVNDREFHRDLARDIAELRSISRKQYNLYIRLDDGEFRRRALLTANYAHRLLDERLQMQLDLKGREKVLGQLRDIDNRAKALSREPAAVRVTGDIKDFQNKLAIVKQALQRDLRNVERIRVEMAGDEAVVAKAKALGATLDAELQRVWEMEARLKGIPGVLAGAAQVRVAMEAADGPYEIDIRYNKLQLASRAVLSVSQTLGNALSTSGLIMGRVTQAANALQNAMYGLSAVLVAVGIAASGSLVAGLSIAATAVMGLVGGFGLLLGAAAPIAQAFARQAQNAQQLQSAQSSARSASEQLANAQRRLGDAIRGVREAERQAAEGVRQAQENYYQTLQGVEDAERQVEQSKEALADATEEVSDATRELNDALATERERLLEMQYGIEGMRISQKQLAMDIAEARREIEQADNPRERREAELRLQELLLRRKQLQLDLAQAQREYNRAQREGTQELQSAQENYENALEGRRDAQQQLIDAERQLAQAQREASRAAAEIERARREGAQRIAEAQRRVVEAQREVIRAQRESAAAQARLSQLTSGLTPKLQKLKEEAKLTWNTWKRESKGAQDQLVAFSMEALRVSRRTMPFLGEQAERAAISMRRAFSRIGVNWEQFGVFPRLRAVIRGMIPIANNLGVAMGNALGGLINILEIATPYARRFSRWVRQISRDFLSWTDSKEGREAIRRFFESAAPVARALGRQIARISRMFARWATDKDTVEEVAYAINLLGDAFVFVMKWVGRVANAFVNLHQRYPGLVEGAAKLTLAFGALGVAFRIARFFLNPVFIIFGRLRKLFEGKRLVDGISKVGGAFRSLGRGLVRVGGFVASAVKWFFRLGRSVWGATSLLRRFGGPIAIVSLAIDALINMVKEMVNFLGPTLQGLWKMWRSGQISTFEAIISAIRTFGAYYISVSLKTLAAPVTAFLRNVLGRLPGRMGKRFRDMADGIDKAINRVRDKIAGDTAKAARELIKHSSRGSKRARMEFDLLAKRGGQDFERLAASASRNSREARNAIQQNSERARARGITNYNLLAANATKNTEKLKRQTQRDTKEAADSARKNTAQMRARGITNYNLLLRSGSKSVRELSDNTRRETNRAKDSARKNTTAMKNASNENFRRMRAYGSDNIESLRRTVGKETDTSQKRATEHFRKMRENAAAAFRHLLAGVKEIFPQIARGITDPISRAKDALQKIWNSILDGVAKVLEALNLDKLAESVRGAKWETGGTTERRTTPRGGRPVAFARGGVAGISANVVQFEEGGKGGMGTVSPRPYIHVWNEQMGPEAYIVKNRPTSEQLPYLETAASWHGMKVVPEDGTEYHHKAGRGGHRHFAVGGVIPVIPFAAGAIRWGGEYMSAKDRALNYEVTKRFPVAGSDYAGHPDGSVDWMVTTPGTVAQGRERELGDAIASWLDSNYGALNLRAIIWMDRARFDGAGWGPYTGAFGIGNANTLAHRDHVHAQTLGPPFGELNNQTGGFSGGFFSSLWERVGKALWDRTVGRLWRAFKERMEGGHVLKTAMLELGDQVLEGIKNLIIRKAGPAGGEWDGGGTLREWVEQGLRFGNAFPPTEENIRKIMARAMQESGGDPNAVNNWDCVDEETRILTRRGYLKHDEVEVGDETLAYNPETGRLEWTRITRVVHYEDARTVRIGHSRWEARVTRNHRWLTKSRNGKVEMRTTDDLAHNLRIVLAAEADTGVDDAPELSVDEAALYGWMAGEGHVERPNRGRGGVRVAISKQRDVEKVRGLLERLGVEYSEYVSKPNHKGNRTHTFRLNADVKEDLFRRGGHPKKDAVELVLRMTPEQREAWLEAVIDAEGHRCTFKEGNKEDVRIYQTDGPVQEAIKLAVYLSGSRPSVRRLSGKEQWSPCAAVCMCGPVVTAGALSIGDERTEDVWCVTTELGTWTAERGGHIFLTGNSNAQRGTPSKGLMQIIEPTWEQWRAAYGPDAGPFDQNWMNPIKSVAVASRYMKGVYGYVVGATGTGYTNGGVALGPHLGMLGDKGPEMMVPLHNRKAVEALKKALSDTPLAQPSLIRETGSLAERIIRMVREALREAGVFSGASSVRRSSGIRLRQAPPAGVRSDLGGGGGLTPSQKAYAIEFWRNATTDPNANRPGYVQAEDGSWVPLSYYGRGGSGGMNQNTSRVRIRMRGGEGYSRVSVTHGEGDAREELRELRREIRRAADSYEETIERVMRDHVKDAVERAREEIKQKLEEELKEIALVDKTIERLVEASVKAAFSAMESPAGRKVINRQWERENRFESELRSF